MGGADWPLVQGKRGRIAITLSPVRSAKQTTPETAVRAGRGGSKGILFTPTDHFDATRSRPQRFTGTNPTDVYAAHAAP